MIKYTTEEKLEILRKRLQETESEMSRIRQLRPLLDLENGWSEALSFEVMSDIVVEWLEDHNIKTKTDFEKHSERHEMLAPLRQAYARMKRKCEE